MAECIISIISSLILLLGFLLVPALQAGRGVELCKERWGIKVRIRLAYHVTVTLPSSFFHIAEL